MTQTIKCEFTVEELKLLIYYLGAYEDEFSDPTTGMQAKIQAYIDGAKPRHRRGPFVIDIMPPLYTCEVCKELFQDLDSECTGTKIIPDEAS